MNFCIHLKQVETSIIKINVRFAVQLGTVAHVFRNLSRFSHACLRTQLGLETMNIVIHLPIKAH